MIVAIVMIVAMPMVVEMIAAVVQTFKGRIATCTRERRSAAACVVQIQCTQLDLCLLVSVSSALGCIKCTVHDPIDDSHHHHSSKERRCSQLVCGGDVVDSTPRKVFGGHAENL